MNKEVYRKLAKHLDQLPDGFPPSSTGAHLRLLERLFTPEEAELALYLTFDRESAEIIAQRAGRELEEIRAHLDEMVQKGLIMSFQLENGEMVYQGIPYIIGIYEFQINELENGLLELLQEYWRTMEAGPEPDIIPQLRTIPIHESIDARLEVLPYEQVNELVDAHTKFAVVPCICRRTARLQGRGCDAPEETCLVFGDWADFNIRTGHGREIDHEEVMSILASANQHNLVLQPTNSQKASIICCCCGCCCGVLRELKQHPRPADAVASAFISTFDEDACIGCFICTERCQMDALVADGDRVIFKPERCIGCGLCVSTCPSGALKLVRKPQSIRTQPPVTFEDTWKTITQAKQSNQLDNQRQSAE